MFTMTELLFKDYLLGQYRKWENTQPNKRASLSAFARWLSDNSYETPISQPLLNDWMSGHAPRTEKYIDVLAEKLGDDVYEVLNVKRPDKYLQIINRLWKSLPEHIQIELSEQAGKFAKQNLDKQAKKKQK